MKKLYVGILALLLGGTSFAQMTIDRGQSNHKWTYNKNFAVAYQRWNGAPFSMEADFLMPKGEFARDCWFGLWVDDTNRKERYIFTLFNETNDKQPNSLSFCAVYYKPEKGFQRKRTEESWSTNHPKVTLRVEFTGKKLIFSSADPGGEFKKRLEITPDSDFKPDQVGLNTDCATGNSPIHGLEICAFRITGNGPAKSDQLDGATPVQWNYLGEKDTDFEYPTPLNVAWDLPVLVPCGWSGARQEPNVFDHGQNAVIGVRAKTWTYGGKKLVCVWKCTDFFGKPIASGETDLVLKAKEDVHGSFTIPGQLLKNGVYKIELTAETDGKKLDSIKQQFAVIPHRDVIPGVFDPASPYIFNYAWSWRLAARMGARKIRQPFWSSQEYETGKLEENARRNGLMLLGPILDVHPGYGEMPGDLDNEAKRIADVFMALNRKHPGVIQALEIFNEPEPIMGGTTELTGFASLFHRVKRRIREAGGSVLLIGCGPLHCNLDYLKRVATVGGQDSVDIVATHGYRSPNRPEFGHAEDIEAIHDLYGKDKPIWCNEDTYFTEVNTAAESDKGPAINLPFGTMIEVDELTQGIYIQRRSLNQLMAGYSGVSQFNDIDNHKLMLSPTYMRSGVVNYAALTWLMKHPIFIKRLTPETDHLWILEWESDGEPCHALWSLNDFHKVTLFGTDELTAYDTFANRIASGRTITLNIGGAPVFIKGEGFKVVSRAITKDVPAVVLPEEKPLSEKPIAVEISGHAIDMKTAVVVIAIKNNSGQEFHGVVTPYFMGTGKYKYTGASGNVSNIWGFEPQAVSISLKPEEIAEYSFKPVSVDSNVPFDPLNPSEKANYSVLWWTEGYRITAVVNGDGLNKAFYSKRPMSLRGIPYLANIAVDADGSDWNAVPVFPQLGEKKRNAGHATYWYGKESYYPEFKFAWNEKGLMFFAKVIDSRHDATQKGLKSWRTDSIQIGLNANHANPDYTNWPLLTLSTANEEVYLQRDTQTRKAGPLKQIEYKTGRVKGNYDAVPATCYECLIPWDVIGLDPAKDKTFGYSILFNNSNGFWRCGWEGYFQPMGGQIVDPRTFGDLTLTGGPAK